LSGERYYDLVRRILATALLVLFSCSLIDPAVFASSDPESNLPACCRRAGKHHCAVMLAETASSAGSALQSSKCRFFPKRQGVSAPPGAGLLTTPQLAAVPVLTRRADYPTGTVYRVLFYSTCQKRGPPSLLLS
jgi:hypothetical protein